MFSHMCAPQHIHSENKTGVAVSIDRWSHESLLQQQRPVVCSSAPRLVVPVKRLLLEGLVPRVGPRAGLVSEPCLHELKFCRDWAVNGQENATHGGVLSLHRGEHRQSASWLSPDRFHGPRTDG